MSTDGRRNILPWLLVAVGAGAAAIGAGTVVHERDARPDPTLAARDMKARIDPALLAAAAALEPQAARGAGVHELRAAWKMRTDRATFQDLLENEECWAPYRTRFALSGVVDPSGLVAVVGTALGDAASGPVVWGARARGVASGVLALPSGPFLAAAATIAENKADAAGAPVVLLATALDQRVLQGIAGQTGDLVGLSDGEKLVEATGPASARPLFAALAGHETAGVVALEGHRVGASWALGPRSWLLAISPPNALAPPAEDRRWVWTAVGGGVLFALGLASAWATRRPAAALSPGPVPLRSTAYLPQTPTTVSGAAHQGTPAPTTGPGAGPGASPGAPASDSAVVARSTRGWGFRPIEVGSSTPDNQMAAPRLTPAHAETLPQMGRYRLIERIGVGGMAEIFFAVAFGAEDFVRHFVVKRMHLHVSRHREVVLQFIDEARLQAGLVHSNIVPVFDFGKAGEEYFLALEYIHGRDLGQVMKQHLEVLGRPLPLSVAFFILHETLDALAYAHVQLASDGKPLEIVHRDVAPGNILVSYHGEVKLTDFGIAKGGRRVRRTEVGIVKGNASFMSPEQAKGESVDLRSDLFSAGLVLYYCLTGQLLYEGENVSNQVLRAAVGPATNQFDVIAQLPPEAAQVLTRALAMDPAERYRNAADFERELVPRMANREAMAALMDTLFPVEERRDLR
jgi:Protein kinase domain